MKKVGILLLILVLTAGLFGCAGKDTNSGKGAEEVSSNAQDEAPNITKESGEKTESPIAADSATTQGTSSNEGLTGKVDQYKTTEIPEGKPAPVEPQKTEVNKKQAYHCTVSITCDTILDNMDKFDEAKLEVLPKNGVIRAPISIEFYEGESAFDALLRATRENKIHMEFVTTPLYNSSYIEGINNIYEFDCSELSGWMYKVNDWFPNYGSSRYKLKDGDKVQWIYTCDLGRDIGGDWTLQQAGREN